MGNAIPVEIWTAFFGEMSKNAAKSPTSMVVPKPGTKMLGGFRLHTQFPGKTPITGKNSMRMVNTSGKGSLLSLGRSGTSAAGSPSPPPAFK